MNEPVVDFSTAIITKRCDLADGQHVDIFVWKPEMRSEVEHVCAYIIVGLGNEKLRYGHGVDDLQAIMLTLQAVGFHLYYSEAYKSGRLTWEGSRDLGLPRLP